MKALDLFIWCQFERIKACSRNTLQYSKDYKNEKVSLSCKSITNCSLQPLENQSRRWIFFLKIVKDTLREKCPHSEFFWALYSRIRTEYWEMRSISPFQSEYGKIRTRKTPNTDTFHSVIFTREKHPQVKLQPLQKLWIWTFE